MNSFVTLLVLVVAASVGPAAGRSALGKALDLVDEFQNIGFSAGSFSDVEATKLIEDMQFIFATSRKGLQEKADKEQTAIDPQTLANLEIMEKLMPRAVRIVADMTSQAEADPSLEPALPDLTGHAAAPAAVVRSGVGHAAAPAAVVRSWSGYPAPVPAPASGAVVVHYTLPGGGYYYSY